MNTLLSLFDYSGNWSQPYREAGWNVVQIDRKILDDDGVFLINKDLADLNAEWFYNNIFENFGTVDGLIMGPPCTDSAASGALHWAQKDKLVVDLFGEFSRKDIFVDLFYQCIRIKNLCKPFFWCLENPVGRLNKLVPELEKYGPRYFQPCDFGEPYTKKTGLWGNFNMPLPTNKVVPVNGSMVQKFGGKSERTKELRSMTPKGFAKAFFEANNKIEYTDEFLDNWEED